MRPLSTSLSISISSFSTVRARLNFLELILGVNEKTARPVSKSGDVSDPVSYPVLRLSVLHTLHRYVSTYVGVIYNNSIRRYIHHTWYLHIGTSNFGAAAVKLRGFRMTSSSCHQTFFVW